MRTIRNCWSCPFTASAVYNQIRDTSYWCGFNHLHSTKCDGFDASEEIDFGYTITTIKSLLTENDITPVRYAQLLCSGAPNRPQFFLAIAEILNKFKIARHLYEWIFIPRSPRLREINQSCQNIIVNQKMFFDLPVENGWNWNSGWSRLQTYDWICRSSNCRRITSEMSNQELKKSLCYDYCFRKYQLRFSFYGLCELSMPTQILPRLFPPTWSNTILIECFIWIWVKVQKIS